MTNFIKELMSHLRNENLAIQQEALALQTEGLFYALKTEEDKQKYNEKIAILKGKTDQLERVIDIINSIM